MTLNCIRVTQKEKTKNQGQSRICNPLLAYLFSSHIEMPNWLCIFFLVTKLCVGMPYGFGETFFHSERNNHIRDFSYSQLTPTSQMSHVELLVFGLCGIPASHPIGVVV